MPRIYADFNGLVRGFRDPSRTAVVLDTFGSLRDLANAGIILHEGLELVVWDASDDDEDLEGHGIALRDPERRWWIVEFDARGVRDVPRGDRTEVTTFLCVGCRVDLVDGKYPGGMTRLKDPETCPSCGTPVAAPIAPPSR